MATDTDEALILSAAKAAGLSVGYSNNVGDFSIGEAYSREEVRWNPLEFDSDAFQLMINCGMKVAVHRESVTPTTTVHTPNGSHSERHDQDPFAATRRAIVKAAANMS